MKLSEEAQAIKQELKNLQRKKRLLKSIQRQIANARADMGGLRAQNYEGVKTTASEPSSVQEQFTALITKLEKKYEIVMEEAFAIEDRIAEAVYCLNETEQSMIIDRYVNGWSWRRIMRECRYAEAQTYRIHNEALEKLAKNKN